MRSRKTLSLLLTAIMLLCLLPPAYTQPASASNIEKPAFGAPLSADCLSLSEGQVTVSLAGMDGKAEVIAAFYDSSSRMVGLDMLTPEKGATQATLTAVLSGKAVRVRVFLMDGDTSSPLCLPLEWPLPYSDAELARAVELGIGPCKAYNDTITYAEFAAMLDEVVLLAADETPANWTNVLENARNSQREMTRREGMVALYLAAESLGPEYYQYNDSKTGEHIFNEIASVDDWIFWDQMWGGDFSLFPDVGEATLNGEASYVNAGYFYSMSRSSLISGKTIFDYDETAKSMRPADPFLYEEGLRAAIRLYESYYEIEPRPMTDADKKILAAADLRREAILNSSSDISVTGTSYYVSTDGSDLNDGLSENTPWASLKKVNETKLQPGDGVFFCRGDIWRGEALIAQNGVTYSAYGSGPKPAIYGSPENGADPEKWSLLRGTDNIWVFYKEIMDCGDIVLDGSMDISDKAPVWWTGSQYVKLDFDSDHEQLLEKPSFDPAGDMENLQYFNDIDYSDLGSQHPIYVYSYSGRKGTLYLRCDEGNPGEIYRSIEFCCDPYNGSVVTLNYGQGSVIDNLAVMYGGHAIESRGGKAVQNCEVGYMGAMTHTFYDAVTVYSGDGIIHAIDMIVENNYVHHVFNGGIAAGEMSFAGDTDASTEEFQGNNIIRGNLLEYTAGITLINWETEANERHMFKNVTIEDNYVMYSATAGDASCKKAGDVLGALVFTGKDTPTPCANENLVIKNNVFYCSDGALIISAMPSEYYPTYSGNVYAQYKNGTFAHWRFRDGTFRAVLAHQSVDLEAFVRDELGDLTGAVLQ